MSPLPRSLRTAEGILARGPESVEVAVAAVRGAHDRLHAEISPVIGVQGFAAVFARCVRQASRAEHRLATAAGLAPEQVSERLWALLAELPSPSAVRAVGLDLLARFFDLMSKLVGDDLTQRLFRNIWPELPRGDLDDTELP